MRVRRAQGRLWVWVWIDWGQGQGKPWRRTSPKATLPSNWLARALYMGDVAVFAVNSSRHRFQAARPLSLPLPALHLRSSSSACDTAHVPQCWQMTLPLRFKAGRCRGQSRSCRQSICDPPSIAILRTLLCGGKTGRVRQLQQDELCRWLDT